MRSTFVPLALLCCAALTSAPVAYAQDTPDAQDAQDAQDAPPGTSPGAPLSAVPVAPFDVDDPMLAPVAAPRTSLSSWSDARARVDAGSFDLRIANAEVARAQGRWRQSLSALLPNASLSAGAGYDFLDPSNPVAVGGSLGRALFTGATGADPKTPTSPLGSAGVSLRQSVVDLSSWSALDGAGAQTRAAEASEADQRRRVVQGLATTIASVAAAERIAELSRVGLKQALERASLTKRLSELGTATQLDVVRVQQDVAVARTALVRADEELRATRESLGAVLGVDHGVGVSPSFSLDDLVRDSRTQCEPIDVDDRPDVLAARATLDAAAAKRREAWTGYLPSLDLTSNAGAYTTDPGPGRFATWTVAAVISVPLWEGGFREGLVEERSAAVTQAEARMELARRDAVLEDTRAKSAERAAGAAFATAKEAHELAQELDRLTRRSFEMGRSDSLDLVQSAVVLRQAQLDLALRELDWLRTRLAAFFTLARCNP
jgi:outer membrane protein TolC